MRIGILTFHNAYNYGAILQTYATQEIIKRFGYEAEVIDYHNKAIDNDYDRLRLHLSALLKRGLLKAPQYFMETFFFRRKRKAFHKFVKKYIHLSEATYSQGDSFSLQGYDVVLIGSDQLWNKRLTGGFDEVYWGNFDAPRTRKIAWSICMNDTNLNDEEIRFVTNHLGYFDSISVREDSLQRCISSLTVSPVFHTLDPTLMLSSQEWSHLCSSVREQSYMVVYAVRKEEETISFARQISRITGKPLVIIRSHCKPYCSKGNKEYCSPTGFLSYIKNADLVITTSFHGTVFSIIFEKQFVCPTMEDNARVSSLLNLLGLSSRLVKDPEDLFRLPSIDYRVISRRRVESMKETEMFLTDVLKIKCFIN